MTVCSANEEVGCQVAKCVSREHVRAIEADTWFAGDMSTPTQWWYTGPGDTAKILLEIQEDGKEVWFEVATLKPIPNIFTYQGETHRMLHDQRSIAVVNSHLMAASPSVVESSSNTLFYCALFMSAGAGLAYLATRREKEDHYIKV